MKDSGDAIEISLNGTLFATLKLSELEDGYYTSAEILKADGSSAAVCEDVSVLEEGAIGFYQRNNNAFVDNLKISEIPEETEDPGEQEPVTPPQEEQPGTGDLGAELICLAALVLTSALIIFRKRSIA